MAYARDYYFDDPNAPFARLLRTIHAHCHPEVFHDGYEELIGLARNPELEEKLRPFKEELREAIDDPGRIPEGALAYASGYEDGSPSAYLRHLWRDLYPSEQVPGGDEQFREDLRKAIHGEVDRLPATVWAYRMQYSVDASAEGDAAFARRVWQDLYPDEPLP